MICQAFIFQRKTYREAKMYRALYKRKLKIPNYSKCLNKIIQKKVNALQKIHSCYISECYS